MAQLTATEKRGVSVRCIVQGAFCYPIHGTLGVPVSCRRSVTKRSLQPALVMRGRKHMLTVSFPVPIRWRTCVTWLPSAIFHHRRTDK